MQLLALEGHAPVTESPPSETHAPPRLRDLPRVIRGKLLAATPAELLLLVVGTAAFLVLYRLPIQTLIRDWWSAPDASHGLLLAPLALFLAWRAGVDPRCRRQVWLGLLLLTGAVSLRYASGLAAELFTMRLSLILALAALTIYQWGLPQVRHWWLPFTLLILSIPLPAVVLTTISSPLQLIASGLGTELLRWRQVPVQLSGNIIQLPGYSLFVTEACSGLRSLTALVALGVLIGGLWLRSPVNRVLLVALTIPVAIVINGLRVFLTGFIVFFVNPALAEGFMHYSEGWALFMVAFLIMSATAFALSALELAFKKQSALAMK
jgi:exosortase